ncbi:hypothetical protein T12_14142 [Trichinella patagoniensis]|uniref:Uncharacterized protein n=1 Tax=Trichinella patagoniensis TaxID=990121 RepID=A0A0V0ZKA9_9BILA|nr:hypothetical protein T12_14142 [Trichinella patagoniensis]
MNSKRATVNERLVRGMTGNCLTDQLTFGFSFVLLIYRAHLLLNVNEIEPYLFTYKNSYVIRSVLNIRRFDYLQISKPPKSNKLMLMYRIKWKFAIPLAMCTQVRYQLSDLSTLKYKCDDLDLDFV